MYPRLILLKCATLLLLIFCRMALSQNVIETLPGYPGKLPFRLETGYIGIGESEEVQLFYYFIESERNPKDDPLMIWLTGGPACSGLSGLIYEMGPFTIDYSNSSGSLPALVYNPYSWTKVANIIYTDQPAGTGYSYAKSWEAYNTNDTLFAAHTYEFLRKWLIYHPKYLDNPLYIGGDSYTGIVVPLVVNKIYNAIEAGSHPPLNMKGYVLGNPLTNKYWDVNERIPYAHRMGLLSDNLFKSVKESCKGNYVHADPNNVLCQRNLERVAECLDKIRTSSILEPWCSLISKKQDLLSWDSSFEEETKNLLRLMNPFKRSWCRPDNYVYLYIWANDIFVQKALHVSEGTIKEWVRCNMSMHYNFEKRHGCYVFNVQSTVEYHRNFTHKHCRALIYSGDHDMVVPHTSTEKWIDSLNLTVQSDWKPWFVESQVAGYTEQYSHNDYQLTYATVKGAGHTGPEYNPMQCFAMVDRWFSELPL
ncbi:serine carboxypeptidase-like 18 isoform X1 [Olea europaea subsp. europaea]|uniref:Serine carboxypeptidase-like 18 isoform X1 n=1 Tax=Olea europaea subsp. europaea TaxID=158383 RepID=A0A8S0TD87_OLEEU|nr:serine carboxypeptidase-like 18 isoform X1 [Olea europaea subsp. europaea]